MSTVVERELVKFCPLFELFSHLLDSIENEMTEETAEIFEVVGLFLKCLGLLSQVGL